jgi:hypothetical protein
VRVAEAEKAIAPGSAAVGSDQAQTLASRFRRLRRCAGQADRAQARDRAIQYQAGRSVSVDSAATLSAPRRFPPHGLQRSATTKRTKPESAWLRTTRRYARTETMRAIGSVFAVVAVVILAGLAWLWVFRA